MCSHVYIQALPVLFCLIVFFVDQSSIILVFMVLVLLCQKICSSYDVTYFL